MVNYVCMYVCKVWNTHLLHGWPSPILNSEIAMKEFLKNLSFGINFKVYVPPIMN